MVCNTCGRQIVNETANFCEYCGAQQAGRVPMYEEVKKPEVIIEKNVDTITFGQWMSSMALIIVPILIYPLVGIIFGTVYLFYWGFMNKNVSETKRNWSKAMLIFMGILVVLHWMILGMILITNPDFYTNIQSYMMDMLSSMQ